MVWITEIEFPRDKEKMVEKLLTSIADKDWEFAYSMLQQKVYIENETEDKSHKRGLWLINNTKAFSNCSYRVYEKK